MPEETRYSNVLVSTLEAQGWLIRKLHGNVFQSGLPDLLMIRPDGEILLIEMKGTRSEHHSCTATEIFNLLKGPQVGTLLLMAKKKAKVGIILGAPNGYFVSLRPFLADTEIFPVSVQKAAELLAQY